MFNATSLLEAALEYSSFGWSVFPLADKRTPLVPWKPYQSEAATAEQIIQWWTDWPDAWIAVALGEVSGLIRIDADGDGALEALDRMGGLPETLQFQSPSGGHGALMRHFGCMRTEVLWTGPGQHQEVRVQSTGAYTVLPPTPGYSWLNDAPVAWPPQWLQSRETERHMETIIGPVPFTVRSLSEDELQLALSFIPADVGYSEWLAVGMALHHIDRFDLWLAWSKTGSKYKEGDCDRWKSFAKTKGITDRTIPRFAQKYGWTSLHEHEELSDAANAKVLARMVEGKLMHSSHVGWLSWDGTRWKSGGEAEKDAVKAQKEALQYRTDRLQMSFLKLLKDGQNLSQEQRQEKDFRDKIKSKQSFAKQIQVHKSSPRIMGTLKLAESEEELRCDHRKLNLHPMLLNCQNGTLDLESLYLKEHDPKDMLTQVTTAPYDPAAEAPRWLQFLQEVFNSDTELVRWFQKLLGYTVTGLTNLHILPILWGSGRNGKSTVVRAVMNALGSDYAGTTVSGLLAVSRNEQHPTRLADLFGKRLAVDLETGDGMQLNEELVKKLTGGDAIKARRLYEDPWEFVPTHKLFIVTNHEPRVQGTDEAIWGRVLKVPFTQSFLGREDFSLDATLQGEAPGILRWLVDGCTMWQREGLGDQPAAVRTATQEYRTEQNTVCRFFEERLAESPDGAANKAAVMAAYCAWCTSNRVRQVSNKTFGTELRQRYPAVEVTRYTYKGLKLL